MMCIFSTKERKIKIPTGRPKRQNWKCCRLGLIEHFSSRNIGTTQLENGQIVLSKKKNHNNNVVPSDL
jgi:hypothetical protein